MPRPAVFRPLRFGELTVARQKTSPASQQNTARDEKDGWYCTWIHGECQSAQSAIACSIKTPVRPSSIIRHSPMSPLHFSSSPECKAKAWAKSTFYRSRPRVQCCPTFEAGRLRLLHNTSLGALGKRSVRIECYMTLPLLFRISYSVSFSNRIFA